MHDSIGLEADGVPTAAVATEAFTSAAEVQARQLGLPAYRVVLVPHPVQNANQEEMIERADSVIEDIVSRLIEGH